MLSALSPIRPSVRPSVRHTSGSVKTVEVGHSIETKIDDLGWPWTAV